VPSVSKAQQRFMGLVHAYKKGEVPASQVTQAVKDAAKSMKKKSTKKFASTKHDDLPNKVRSENMNEDGHTDVASAERKLKLIIKDAMDTINALRGMSNEDSLPSWWTDKITLAKDYVGKSRDYIMNPAESVDEIFPKGAGRKISKAMQKGYTLYTTDKRGKKVKKIKTYDSRQAAAVAMGKLMKNLDTNYFPKNVDGFMYVQESVNEVSGVDVAKKVLKNKQHEKGIDLQTANLIVTIDKAYDKNPRLQKKFRAIQLPKMKQLILKYFA